MYRVFQKSVPYSNLCFILRNTLCLIAYLDSRVEFYYPTSYIYWKWTSNVPCGFSSAQRWLLWSPKISLVSNKSQFKKLGIWAKRWRIHSQKIRRGKKFLGRRANEPEIPLPIFEVEKLTKLLGKEFWNNIIVKNKEFSLFFSVKRFWKKYNNNSNTFNSHWSLLSHGYKRLLNPRQ